MTRVVVGDKGRIVIPAAVRADAGVDVGDELIARAVSDGQIVLETRAVIARRIRSQFVDAEGTDGLRQARSADIELEQERRIGEHSGGRDLEAERRRGDQILLELGAEVRHTEAS